MKENRKFISSTLLICLAAIFCACQISSASAGSVAKKHVAETERMYKKQDQYAAQSRKLAVNGKYDEAIKLLQEKVISELELEAEAVDSWIARKRLVEFKTELRNIQLKYGTLTLEAAEKALLDNKFDDAIAFAEKAAAIAPQLFEKKAANLIKVIRGRQNASKRAAQVSVEHTDPELKNREKKLRQALAAAQMFFRKGMYDDALAKIEEVYALNPYNTEAAYLSTQIYKRFYQIGLQRRRADLQAQFAYEAWQWVEPNFPRDETPSEPPISVKKNNDSAIQKLLDTIKINFKVKDMGMEEVIATLNRRQPKDQSVNIMLIQSNDKKNTAKKGQDGESENDSEDNDGENDGSGDGENDGNDEDDYENENEERSAKSKKNSDEVLITLTLNDVPLRQVLDYISFLSDYSYVIHDDGVVFGAPDQRMVYKDYEIYDTVKFLIVGRKKPAPAAAAPAGGDAAGDDGGDAAGDDAGDAAGDDGGDAAGDDAGDDAGMIGDGVNAGDMVDDSELTPDVLKKFFSMYGIGFPKGSSISYFRGKISMHNTEANHVLFEELYEKVNVQSHMIEVEVKSIELSEQDMEELGFNWALSGIGKGDNDSSKQWMFAKGENTSEGGALNMLNGLLSGVDSRLISNLNIFPDLFGSFKPFGSDVSFNLTLTINALDRSNRTEQISAPRVLVANGFPAVVKMTKAYFFPEEWEELEVETEEVGDQGNIRLEITYPSPTFAETESEIGTIFTVTPTIQEDGETIRLKLNPKVSAYTGKDEYEVVLVVEELVNDKWEKEEMRFVVWRPVIATREVAVTVDVNHGETMVIGGLSDSQSQKRLDKIPILADIPFIGRLFQNQSEISVRRNMLIFVTARLIDNSGIPYKKGSKVGNSGIPLLKR